MLKKDGKPTTFGPGYFKRTPEKSGLGPEWDRILEDRRNAYRTAAQLQEINRRRQIAEIKKAAGSPLQNLLSAGGSLLANSLLNRGGNWLTDSLFGSSTPTTATTGGKGLLSSLFGGGSDNAASKLTTPGETPSFMSGYSGGYPGPVNPTPPVAPATNQGGFFSNLWGGGEGGNATGITPGSEIFATYGIPAAAAAATYLAGKSALDTLQGKTDNSSSGKFGRGQLAFTTMGLSELGKFLGGPNQDKWDTERKRLKGLRDSGVNVPRSLLDNSPERGRSVEELLNNNYANDFIGTGKNNEWVNNRFAQSRDVKDLRPEDVLNYSAFAEKTPGWFDASLEQRKQIAKYALDNGLVNEGRGTIDLSQSSDYDTYVKQILGL